VGICISTRPDCIDEEKIKLISSYQKDYLVWIEYGLQTTDNNILSALNRQHTYGDFLTAISLTRKYKINAGVHLILGLAKAFKSADSDAEKIASLDIQGIKFHVLHILKDTVLKGLHENGRVTLLSEEEYIRSVCDFLEKIPKSIVVLRLASNAKPEHLIAPLWINKKNEIITRIKEEFSRRGTYQGSACEKT
jgi:hypothetical protein